MRAARITHRLTAVAAAALVLVAAPDIAAQNDERTVLEAEVRGVITPVIADYLQEAVQRAEREGHEALLVTLDTPGGLDTSMRDIVQSFLNARVPVVVWVAPAGARAASAGAIMALAAHVAAMAPGTNIGAATPVALANGAEAVGDKLVNDGVAYSVAIAELRGRDEEFAEEIVRDGRSEPASIAVRIGAVDLLADGRGELLSEIDGREVVMADQRTVTLRTSGAAVIPHDMGLFQSVRQRLADPNLAFLFLSLGTLAIIYELANPGVGFGGILGVILLVLGFFALAVLPVNFVGVVLLLLAAGLFIGELFVPGVGVMAAGGAVSLVLGGLFLVRGGIGVNLAVILPTVAVVMAAVVVAGRLVWRARRSLSRTGSGLLQGLVGEVRRIDGRRGQVFLEGSWWTVRADEPLEEGQRVRVKAVEGLELIVEKQEEEEAS